MSSTPKRVWIDMTNSPHVLVLRPIIDEFKRRGWEVDVTAREFAQTIPLLERFEIPYTLIGKHQGKKTWAKIKGLLKRSRAMVRFGKQHGYDLGVSHASNDLPVACKWLGIPHVTMFDYEFAKASHNVNIRCSKKVLVPDVITLDVLRQYGCTEKKYDTYPGLKEEYYLADFEPDPAVLDQFDVDPEKILVTLRTPPTMAAYHRVENPLFDDVLQMIAKRDDTVAIVLPRTPDQIPGIEAVGADNIIVSKEVVDAQSLVYYSDIVISGGGTINREAVALGTPAWTIFKGIMGAVDKNLIAQGRLHELTTAEELADNMHKKDDSHRQVKRDPALLVDKMIKAAKGLDQQYVEVQ